MRKRQDLEGVSQGVEAEISSQSESSGELRRGNKSVCSRVYNDKCDEQQDSIPDKEKEEVEKNLFHMNSDKNLLPSLRIAKLRL